MEEFYIDGKQLYDILKERGITNLYHANTVLTSRTFIEQGALLSRGHVEDNNLDQTSQMSDDNDKVFKVWYDIFLDGLDLGEHYNRPNVYGPILFIMKLELLLSPSIGKILITKDNPMYWRKGISLSERYYSDIDGFKRDYLNKGRNLDARIMFTFRDADKLIKLNKFCDSILIDKNGRKYKDVDIDDQVYLGLYDLLKSNKLGHIKLNVTDRNIKKYLNINFSMIKNLFKRNKSS